MEITKQDVEKVAKLARLDVSPTETEAFARQLSQILTHVEQLNRYSQVVLGGLCSNPTGFCSW